MEIPDNVDGDGKRTRAYSSYFHLDVKDKWVMMFGYLPEGISQEERVKFRRFASLRFKALTARQKGAKEIIIVSGPTSKVVSQLVPLSFDASMAGSGLAATGATAWRPASHERQRPAKCVAYRPRRERGGPVGAHPHPAAFLCDPPSGGRSQLKI